MSMVRVMITAVAIVVLAASWLLAQDKPAAPAARSAETFEAVKKEFQTVGMKWLKARNAEYEEAKKNGKEKGFEFAKGSPFPIFAPRFLAIAEQYPDGPDAIDAVAIALRCSVNSKDGPGLEARRKAIKLLADYHAAKPSIKKILGFLASSDKDDLRALVAEVIACNPDRKIQAAAFKGLIAQCERIAQFAGILKDPKWFDWFWTVFAQFSA
jgi:hypothetical protein